MPKEKSKYKKGKCIIEKCPSKDRIYCRGLCITHYALMRKTVQKGNHTWKEFEDYEMALPSAKGNPRYKKTFEEMLVKKIKCQKRK